MLLVLALLVASASLLAQLGREHQLFFVGGIISTVLGIIGGLVLLVPWVQRLLRRGAARRARLNQAAVPESAAILWILLVPAVFLLLFTIGSIGLLVFTGEFPRDPYDLRYLTGTIAFYIYPLVLIAFAAVGTAVYRSAVSLNGQKRSLSEMLNRLAGWRDTETEPSQTREGETPIASQAAAQEPFDDLLRRLCQTALLAAADTSVRRSAQAEDRVCLLFLANPGSERFSLRACSGGTPGYLRHLRGGGSAPHFLDPERFAARYNEFCERVRRAPPADDAARFNLIEDFREGLGDCCSTAAFIYGMNRRLGFNDTYDRCITTSFAYLRGLDADEQKRNQFQQLVGVPLKVNGRKAGVLLMLSTERKWIYPFDKLHLAIGDLVSAALQSGFEQRVLGVEADWLDSLPPCAEPSNTRVSRLLESINPDFSRPVFY